MSKTAEGEIFPLNPTKKKSQYQTELNQPIKVDKHEELDIINQQDNNDIKATIKHHSNKPKEAGTLVEPVVPADKNMKVDDILAEEVMVKIVNELSKTPAVINILSNAIAERFLEQMNTNQIMHFINENTPGMVDPQAIYFKDYLLKYSAVLQDQISISIKQITSNLLTNKR